MSVTGIRPSAIKISTLPGSCDAAAKTIAMPIVNMRIHLRRLGSVSNGMTPKMPKQSGRRRPYDAIDTKSVEKSTRIEQPIKT